MSEMSEIFLHPQDVCSQSSTHSKKYNPSAYSPNRSVKDYLETSNSSLFGSEDMDQAFRDYYSRFSPERLYQSFEEEVNKIKNSQDPAKTAQKPNSINNTTDDYLSDATFDSGRGYSEPLSGSLFNSEDMEISLHLPQEEVQEKIEQSEKPKTKNMDKSVKKPLQEQNMSVKCDDIQVILSHLTLENEVNQIKSTAIIRESPQKTVPNKRKTKTPRKIQHDEKLTDSNHKTTPKDKTFIGVFKSSRNPINADYSFENKENNLLVSAYSNEHRLPTASPIPRGITKEEQMIWLRHKRDVGLWAMCDRCRKWRYLMNTTDPLDLPDRWYCYMNPDFTRNNCSQPEEKISLAQERELIRNKYHAGSIVFAKIKGMPWWPAMVQDDPEYMSYFITKNHSNTPKYYHVSFFCCNKPATGWIYVKNLKCFRRFSKDDKVNQLKPQEKYLYQLQIKDAKMEAWKALKLTTIQRLFKYAI